MDKLTKRFYEQVRQVHSQIEELLTQTEFTSTQNIVEQSESQFEALNTPQLIEDLGIGLPSHFPLRVPFLFSRCAPFFESGLLFMKSKDQWAPFAAFQQGVYFPLSEEDTKLRFNFKNCTLVDVVKILPADFTHQLQSLAYPIENDLTHLMIKPHPDYAMLFSSKLPDLWLKPHIQRVQSKILILLSDEV